MPENDVNGEQFELLLLIKRGVLNVHMTEKSRGSMSSTIKGRPNALVTGLQFELCELIKHGVVNVILKTRYY